MVNQSPKEKIASLVIYSDQIAASMSIGIGDAASSTAGILSYVERFPVGLSECRAADIGE